MSIKFRWVGPGYLKEEVEGIVTMHKPGKLLETHSLPDARVKQLVSEGLAEFYELVEGVAVKVSRGVTVDVALGVAVEL